MKTLFKKWNLFEILLLIAGVAISLCCFIFSKERNFLSLISSILGITTVIFTAKGLFFAPIVNIVYLTFYAIVSFMQKYYGEVLLSVCWSLPICILAIVSWLKNKNEQNDVVKVNTLKTRDIILFVLGSICAGVGLYFILRALNTSQLLISTFVMVLSINAVYFSFRRCKFYAIFFILSDALLIVMWLMAVIHNGVGYLPMLINFFFFLINDIYALFRWFSQAKNRQNYDIVIIFVETLNKF